MLYFYFSNVLENHIETGQLMTENVYYTFYCFDKKLKNYINGLIIAAFSFVEFICSTNVSFYNQLILKSELLRYKGLFALGGCPEK